MSGAIDIIWSLSRRMIESTEESVFQSGIERVLSEAGHEFQREVKIGDGDRIDFLAGDVGIEVKIDGSPNTVLRQLMRYAESDRVEQLVLVTTKARHKELPRTVRGKPLYVYFQGGLG